MFMTVWLVALYDAPVVQVILLIITNGLYLAYLLYNRPYINTLNTIVTPLMLLPLILLESYMIYFNKNDKSLSSD